MAANSRFLLFRTYLSVLAAQRSPGFFNDRTSAAGVTGARGWFPQPATIVNGTIYVPVAQAAGKNYVERITNNGNTVTLATMSLVGDGATQSSRTAIPVSLNAGDATGSDATEYNLQDNNSATSAAQNIFMGFSYDSPFPNDDTSFHYWGDDAFNLTVAATNLFTRVGQATVAATATESATQVPWPIGGTFQFFYFAYKSLIAANGDSVSMSLRIAGANAITFTLPGTAGGVQGAVVDVNSFASVTPGQLVNFRYNRTAGTATAFTCYCCFGFQAAH